MRDFLTVAEDIEWLRDQWWHQPEGLTDADVRRGGATLRRLLLDGGNGAILTSWRTAGFESQPNVDGPDIEPLLALQGHRIERVVNLISGGGRVNGIDVAMLGLFRVDNRTTGISADADEGFAVEVGSIVRAVNANGPQEPGPLDSLVHRTWMLSHYLDAIGAIRRGQLIRRRDLLQYFCKLAGSVHLDRILKNRRDHPMIFESIREMEGKVSADWRDGLMFEILSIGQAIGRSPDMHKLASAIRNAAGD